MNNPLISIIVPIYNAERYLNCCIDSILSQTFADFELLLIDDGSSDKSGDICDKYAQLDMRIKVIHKPNTGVSDARNCALDIAIGKYVMFMDADDFLCLEDALEQLHEVAEQYSLDIVRGEYKAVDDQGNMLFSRSVSKYRMKYANHILGSYEFLNYAVNGEFFLWLCLLRRDIIGDLRFEVGRIFLEDMKFFLELLGNKMEYSCFYIPYLRFYAYRKHISSISFMLSEKKLGDAFNLSRFCCVNAEFVLNNRLKYFYINNSYKYYVRTLTTLGYYDEYFTNRKILCNRFNLNELRVLLKKIYRKNGLKVKFHLLVPIDILIVYFRFKILFLNFLYKIKY